MRDSGGDNNTATPDPHEQAPVRYHALDAVRAFALLLGILFHAAESFVPYIQSEWPIKDWSQSTVLGVFFFVCHIFRMQVFFVIAGFFARLVMLRQGVRGFIKHRCQRILLPFALAWLVLYPIVIYMWIWAGLKTQTLVLPPEAEGWPAWLVTLGFFARLRFLGDEFSIMHLWFLYYLAVLYLVALLLRALVGRYSGLVEKIDGLYRGVLSTPLAPPVLALPVAAVLTTMKDWFGVDTPIGTLIPDVPVTAVYLCFFGVGWFLHRQPALLGQLVKRWRLYTIGALVFAAPLALFFLLGLEQDSTNVAWLKPTYAYFYALDMWFWVFACIGFFGRFYDKPSATWRYLADSSYWLYLVHLPLVMAMQIAVSHVQVHWLLKFPLILLLAAPILFVSYHYLVRPTRIGRLLNGRVLDRQLPWAKQ